jgi:glutamyl-tRNA reductase
MTLFLLGIDHKIAPINVREAVYWKRREIAEFWDSYGPCQAAILSTCGRFEIYGAATDAFEAKRLISEFQTRFDEYFAGAYIIYGEDSVLKHLARLAAGLESQIKCESQIYEQICNWAGRKDFPIALANLAHDALLAGHEIRAVSGGHRNANNIATLLYEQLSKGHDSDELLNIVVAGTGKIAELFASYKPQGPRISFAAHKNILKAEVLAAKTDGKAFFLKDLPRLLLKADILISATSSPHRVFDRNYFSKIAVSREKELYIYDLALPRDVDPAAKHIKGIVLKNIDEVILNAHIKNRLAAEPVSH